jgi:hypothetical protein
MKALPIIILSAFLFSGCTQQDMDAFGRATHQVLDGYYGRPYVPPPVVTPVVTQPAPYYQY